jgi:Tfp pilus assembly protein PilX
MRPTSNKKGMALPMALAAIVIIGGLISAAVYVSTQDYRIASNTARESQAIAVAEYGLNRALQDWQTSANLTMVAGDTVKRAYTLNGGTANVMITRLPGSFFWATSEATTGGVGQQARRRYGSLLRINNPNVQFLGAVTAAGNVRVSGNVTLSGNDVSPSGWTSCPTTANIPGSVISPTATVTVNGSVSVSGNPPYTTSAAAADTNTYFSYGNMTYASLAALANITLPGGTYNGMAPTTNAGVLGLGGILGTATCRTTDVNNWGDPVRHIPAAACETYFPIIHVTGNLSVSNGTGQGILLIDGDFTKAGNFSFYGLVIARGTIRSSGSNNGVTGAEMAAAIDEGDAVTLSGNTKIQYSSCVLANAFNGSSSLAPVRQRAWVDLY